MAMVEKAQQIHPLLANVACVVYAVLYIAGFYLFQRGPMLSRNHPAVIRNRIKAVTFACPVIATIVWVILPEQRYHDFIKLLGILPPTSILGLLGPLLLVAILFLGPLTQLFFEEALPFQKNFNYQEDFVELFWSLFGLRNFVVAPITEEFVFRACVISTLYHAGFSSSYLVFISPMYFGFAHLHHAWDTYHQNGINRQALQIAILTSAFQFCYTTIFGWYVSFVFLRLGSVWPPIICHIFCNIMGFPDISGIYDRKKPAERTIIYSAYIAGVLLFFYWLYPLTRPSLVGGTAYWST